MKSKHLYYALLSTVVLLVLALGGSAYGANTVLSTKATKLGNLKAKSQAIEEVQSNLTKSKADLVKYRELNEIAKAIVPQDKDQTQTVREIVKIAGDNGISSLTSIVFPASTLGAVKDSGITQALPVKGMKGVYLIPITVTVNDDNAVPYVRFIAFLRGLEQNRRTSQVSSINLKPDENNPDLVSFTIIINEYIKP